MQFEFDKNNNGIFEENEKNIFLKNHLFTIKENNYNLYLQINENEIEDIKLKNITLKTIKNRLNLSFEIPVKIINNITFCTIDSNLYMAYKLNKLITNFKTEIEKSEFDFCIGIKK